MTAPRDAVELWEQIVSRASKALARWIRSGRRAPGTAAQAPVREREQPTCCATAKWVAERDLGHARGFEFDLGRCERCGTPWMYAYCVASSMGGYEPISREEAGKLKGLAQAELAAEVRAWGNRLG